MRYIVKAKAKEKEGCEEGRENEISARARAAKAGFRIWSEGDETSGSMKKGEVRTKQSKEGGRSERRVCDGRKSVWVRRK